MHTQELTLSRQQQDKNKSFTKEHDLQFQRQETIDSEGLPLINKLIIDH